MSKEYFPSYFKKDLKSSQTATQKVFNNISTLTSTSVNFYQRSRNKLFITLGILVFIFLSGCAGSSTFYANNGDDFYARKAEREAYCREFSHQLHPAYPTRRGVKTNFWFTRDYDLCLAGHERQAERLNRELSIN